MLRRLILWLAGPRHDLAPDLRRVRDEMDEALAALRWMNVADTDERIEAMEAKAQRAAEIRCEDPESSCISLDPSQWNRLRRRVRTIGLVLLAILYWSQDILPLKLIEYVI